jgi:drug/metabolite transporter (DMT)-like permease
MKRQYWFWLVLAQVIWASSYIAMKVAVESMPVSVIVFLRYGIASAGFLCIWLFSGLPRLQRRDWVWIVGLGVFNFALSPTLQILGVSYTQAADASVLIAFEPIITVLVATLALRERPSNRTLLALLIATMGLMILSGVTGSADNRLNQIRLLGNLLFLSSLVFEAAVSVSGRALAPRYRADHLIGSMTIAGFLIGGAINAPTIGRWDFGSIPASGWGAVLFLGLACSVFTYIIWFSILKNVPVNRVALSLFIQPVAGTILGATLLHEVVNPRMLVGALIICVSLIWWQLREMAAAPAS